MAFLAEQEPDHAVEAEAVVSALEWDAALTARVTSGLERLIATCVATGRKIAVISDVSEDAVVATLRAHAVHRHVAAVAARQGLDLSTVDTAHAVERAAGLLDADVTACLLMSANSQHCAPRDAQPRWARAVRAAGTGVNTSLPGTRPSCPASRSSTTHC
jgi:hypothetical protein